MIKNRECRSNELREQIILLIQYVSIDELELVRDILLEMADKKAIIFN